MKKIKILYYGYTDNIGGIEKYLINIYRNIDKSKFEIKFLIFNNQKPCFYDEIKNDIIYITPRKVNYLKFRKELKKIYSNENFDIVHLNYVDFSCYEPALYAKKYSNAKVILHSHIAFYKLPSFKTKILNEIGLHILIKNDDSFYKVGCSELANKYLFKNFKRKDAIVLNNGIDVDNFKFNSFSRKKIREELKIENDTVLLGNVGRMVYQKNQKYLIDILCRLKEKNKKRKYKLLIIGNGPLKDEIIKYSKYKNVFEDIIFKQDINNIYDYMSAMDLFVFPSNFEGLGIVLIEAQASGLKCITSKGLVPEEANLTGFVKYEDLANLDGWVDYIISNSNFERYDKIPDIKKLYDINTSVNYLQKFYDSILKDENNEK